MKLAMRVHRWSPAVFLISLAAPAVPRAAHADAPAASTTPASVAGPVEEARRRFQRGVKFSKDGDFRAALVDFQEAYRIAPNFKVLYNVGQTCEELQDFAGAVKAFRRYLEDGGLEIPKARRTLVEDELTQLEGHVARLDVEAAEPGVDLVAEGDRKIDLGKTPLTEAVLLNSGAWEITARKDGFDPQVERVTLAGGDRKKLVVALKKVETSAPVLPAALPPLAPVLPPPPPLPTPVHSMTPVWIGAGVTGALAVSAAVTGGFALGAKSDYDAKLGTFGVSPGTVSRASDHAQALALATDIQIGAAIVAAGVTTVLFFTSKPSSKSAAARLELLVSLAGLGAHGAF